MANPLMPAMLSQILLKQGRKISHTTRPEAVHLKKAQEDWLRDSILKPKTTKPDTGIKMVTLESLRGEGKEDKKEAPKTDREKVEKTMVTLASIGKLYKG